MADSEKERYFEEIFDRYSKDIFRYLYFRLSSYEAAEDMTGDVFVAFWKKISGDVEVKNARALLYTIAHGFVVDEYRKKKHTGTVSIDDVDPALFGQDDSTEEDIDTKDEIHFLFTHIASLRQEYRDVLLLYYIDELDVREIAAMLKKKEGTVRVLIHRALETLKKIYER